MKKEYFGFAGFALIIIFLIFMGIFMGTLGFNWMSTASSIQNIIGAILVIFGLGLIIAAIIETIDYIKSKRKKESK